MITHETAGRINVKRGDNSVTLDLWGWALRPDAVLTFDEARKLIRLLEAAMQPPKARATAPVVEDDYDDIA